MGLIHSPSIVRDGLTCYLDIENPRSYYNGNTWYDLSGNNINATFVNTITYQPSKPAYLATNGTNSYINIASFIQSIDNTDNTFSMWFKCPTTPPNNDPVISDNYGPEWGIWRDQNNDVRAYAYGNSGPTNIANDEWVNVTFSWFASPGDSGGPYFITTWINGEIIGIGPNITGVVGNGLNDTSFKIGADPSNSSQYMEVHVSVVQHYNRRLTDSEVKQNVNALRGRYGV